MTPSRQLQTLLALAALAIVLPSSAQRQAAEPELKAAILVNMLLFVDWPATSVRANERLSLCHLGSGPVAVALEQLSGRSLKGQSLRVSRVEPLALGDCQVVYFGPADAPHLQRLVSGSQPSAVLLVSDGSGYSQRGAMINLEIDQGRVVFDIDLRAVRQAGLTISSKMLRLARQVTE